ncbi:hypothetical protein [Okibacterium endophyticum]
MPAATVVAAATLALTGCVSVQWGEDEGGTSPTVTTESTQPSEPSAEGEETQPEETTEPKPSDDGESEDERETVEVVLAPESETAVVYIRTIQDFSPLLEVWTVDEAAGTLEYRRYTCLGTTDSAGGLPGAGVGSLTPGEDEGEWTVTWEGESPMRMSRSATESLVITERTLDNSGDIASTHHDIEIDRYVGVCGDTGEAILRFVI